MFIIWIRTHCPDLCKWLTWPSPCRQIPAQLLPFFTRCANVFLACLFEECELQ